MTTYESASETPRGTGGSEDNHEEDGPPLRLKLKDYVLPDCGDAYQYAWAADRLQFGIRVQNMADDAGDVCVEVTLYERVPEVDCRDVGAWWPAPRGWEPTACVRLCGDDLWDAFSDARWEENHSRAYLLHVRHEPGCCGAARAGIPVSRQEWFVQYSQLELAADLDYGSFPHREEGGARRV